MRIPISIAVIVTTVVLAAPATARKRLDATFVTDRVLVDLPAKHGGTLRFYTDTGGGGTLIFQAAAKRLDLDTGPMTGPAADEFPRRSAKFGVRCR